MSNGSGAPIAPLARAGHRRRLAEAAAIAFLTANRQGFGLQAASSGLKATRTLDAGDGRSMVRVQQSYMGLPILGADLNVQLDGRMNVLSVNGKSLGDLAFDPTPSVTLADAKLAAIEATARAYRVSKLQLKATMPELVVHDPRVLAARPSRPCRVEGRGHQPRTERVPRSGADRRPERPRVGAVQRPPHAAPANATQFVCDAKNTPNDYPCTGESAVSSPAKSKVADVKNAFNFAENTYDFYARRFGRNSLDNKAWC